MKPSSWHRYHKWFGIVVCMFLVMFVLSGIILNHREQFADCDISRRYLPSRYEYDKWNGGLMRGSMAIGDDSVLIYGANGIWLFDRPSGQVGDFNSGLPEAADSLNFRRIVKTRGGRLIAASTTGVYVLDKSKWNKRLSPVGKITDIEARGDSVVVLTRSNLYLDSGDGTFKRVELKASEDSTGMVSLFRTVWCLHSGELFGMGGRLFMDFIGLTLLFLCLSGIIVWLGKSSGLQRWSIKWHNKIGAVSIVFTLLMVVSGWCLRPPVMVPLALTKTSPVPGTSLDSDNPWEDRLRAIRYDEGFGDWIISTSDGFFSLPDFSSSPRKLVATPPVSVMGINVWQKDSDGTWLCGSFSGMYRWNRRAALSTDYFSGEEVGDVSGPPFGKNAISGYSSDFGEAPLLVDYYEGTALLPQSPALAQLPMSLWNLALEVHSGRIYIGAAATYVFIFFVGLAVSWCLFSGYKIRF